MDESLLIHCEIPPTPPFYHCRLCLVWIQPLLILYAASYPHLQPCRFGWYGFNPGSTACLYGCTLTASLVAVNTTLAAATGGLTVLALSVFLGRPGDIGPTLNGILAALVAITSPCAYVQPYAAVIIGAVSPLLAYVLLDFAWLVWYRDRSC